MSVKTAAHPNLIDGVGSSRQWLCRGVRQVSKHRYRWTWWGIPCTAFCRRKSIAMVSTSRTILAASIALFSAQVNAFATSSSAVRLQRSGSEMHMIDVSSICGMADTLPALGSSPGLLIAETDAWVQPTALLLGPFLNFLSLAMVSSSLETYGG